MAQAYPELKSSYWRKRPLVPFNKSPSSNPNLRIIKTCYGIY